MTYSCNIWIDFLQGNIDQILMFWEKINTKKRQNDLEKAVSVTIKEPFVTIRAHHITCVWLPIGFLVNN